MMIFYECYFILSDLNFIWFSIIWNISPGCGILPVSSFDHTGTSANKYICYEKILCDI